MAFKRVWCAVAKLKGAVRRESGIRPTAHSHTPQRILAVVTSPLKHFVPCPPIPTTTAAAPSTPYAAQLGAYESVSPSGIASRLFCQSPFGRRASFGTCTS